MQKDKDIKEKFNEDQQEVLKSIRVSRIILPVLIGLSAVGYLLWKQFDPEDFSTIQWSGRMLTALIVALMLAVVRHLSYSIRLRLLSGRFFSLKKSIELIFIWEFSSTVSPTSLGGSAVAFFILAQERLSAARTATIVLYTVVLDSIFLLSTLPVLFLLFGPAIMRPEAKGIIDVGGWGVYFLFAYGLMLGYCLIFYYGLFVNPVQIKRFLGGITSIRFLRRYRRKAIELGVGMKIASEDLKSRGWTFHLKAFLSTATAWSSRFLVLNCLITGFIPDLNLAFWPQFELYSRVETMFFIIAFSPTPGGAGLIELLFNGFLTDYVSNPTYATTIATVWRLISYWVYLLAGVIIIPNWLQNILKQRRLRRLRQQEEQAKVKDDLPV